MEYTSQPAGNEGPDAHDYEQLAQIYAHSEGGDTGGNGGGKGKKFGLGNTPKDWGRPTDYDGDGRPNVFVREMDGALVVTHVTWAIGEGPQGGDHHHVGEHH